MAENFDIPVSAISPVSREDVKFQYGEHGEVSYSARFLNRSRILPERLLNICGNKKSMLSAMTLSNSLVSSFSEHLSACVYIIGADELNASKVGVSQNPAKRISELQTASPYKLMPHYLFWMPLPHCFGIEKLSHRVASKLDLALKGEWMKGRPEAAGMVVASVITEANVRVCSSGMHLRNMKEMVNTIDKLKGEYSSNMYSQTIWDRMHRCEINTA